jgi:cohesin loading factor subunit SCC2
MSSSWYAKSISTSIIQRYLHYVLQAALTPIDAEGGKADKQILLRPALQAISFTVKQGLANPMQSLPILIALETSDDALVAKKAFTMHSSLHSKHSALVNMRMSDSIKKAFHYQVSLSSRENVQGKSARTVAHVACI